MHLSRNRSLLWAVAAIIGISFTSADLALAQAGAQAGSGSGVLEEVVVTARKRTESLQEVPIAIAAFSGEDLKDLGVDELVNLGRMTPNVTMNETSGLAAGTLEVFIRGIGNDPGFEQGVGVYLDDVYSLRASGLLLEVYDVERIEILKGPQGNLYGRNTTGGAIRYVSREPGDEVTGSLDIKAGSYGLAKVKGSYSTPLTDTISGSFGFSHKQSNGYQENMHTGEKHGAADAFAWRANLVFRPSDRLKVKLVADYSKDESLPLVPNRHAVNLDGSSGLDAFNAILTTADTILGGAGAGYNMNPQVPEMLRFSPERLANLASSSLGSALYGGALDTSLPMDIDRVNTGFVNALCDNGKTLAAVDLPPVPCGFDNFEIESKSLAATVEWDITDSLTLKSITAVRYLDNVIPFDFDGSPQIFINTQSDREQQDFTQEFQFNYSTDRLNAVVGFYYLDGNRDAKQNTDQQAGLRLSREITNTTKDERNDESVSIYATFDIDLTDRWQVSVGGRYTHDARAVDQRQLRTTTLYPALGLTEAGVAAFEQQIKALALPGLMAAGLTAAQAEAQATAIAEGQTAGLPLLAMLIDPAKVDDVNALIAATGTPDMTGMPTNPLYEWARLDRRPDASTDVRRNPLLSPEFVAMANMAPAREVTPQNDESWTEFTPSLRLSYQASDDVMLYGGYATGFKAGGFLFEGDEEVPPTYDPEKVKTYTLGVKSTLLDGSARLNVELFLNDYTDKQLAFQEFDADSGRLVRNVDNVGEATTQGAEVEFTWLTPVEGLTLNLHAGYLDSKIDEYLVEAIGADGRPIMGAGGRPRQMDVADSRELGFAPEWTAQARLAYEFPLRDAGYLTLAADATYRDEAYTNSPIDVTNSFDVQAVSDAHTIWNAGLTFRARGERWRGDLFISNLTDERVLVNSFNVSNFMGGGYNPPRMTTLGISYNF